MVAPDSVTCPGPPLRTPQGAKVNMGAVDGGPSEAGPLVETSQGWQPRSFQSSSPTEPGIEMLAYSFAVLGH